MNERNAKSRDASTDSGNKAKSFTSFIFKWLKQVHADEGTTAPVFRLAYVLSQHFNRSTRSCFPLQSTLAHSLGVSDRMIRVYIVQLLERGHLRVYRRGRNQSSIYEGILLSGRKPSKEEG